MVVPGHSRALSTIAAFTAMGAGLVTMATYESMLLRVQTSFSLSVDAMTSASLLPAAGSMLVIFVVSAVATRWGGNRLLAIAALLFVSGAIVTMVAPNLGLLSLGRLIGNVAGAGLGVAGLATLQFLYPQARSRARILGVWAAMTPAVFLFLPPLSAWMVTTMGWRTVPVLWVAMGLVVLGLTRVARTVPPSGQSASEWWSPALAGVSLAALGLGCTLASSTMSVALAAWAVSAVAAIAALIAWRRAEHPGLDVRVFAPPGARWMILALPVAAAVNLAYFTSLMLNYRYSLGLSTSALLMLLPQAMGIIGGLAGGQLSSRIGAGRAAASLLFAACAGFLLILLVQPDTGLWLPLAIASLAMLPIAGCIGPLAQVLFSFAPPDGSAGAAAWRDALWTVGATVGASVVAFLVYSQFQSSLTAQLVDQRVSAAEASRVAQLIRDGAIIDDLVQSDPLASLPVMRAALTGDSPVALRIAQNDALHAIAALGAVTNGVAGGLVLVTRRRSRDPRVAGAGLASSSS